MSVIEFTVNGNICRVDECLPRYTSLNAYIRYTLALPGTKAMCHEGGCGSCIVMVRAKRPTSGNVETFSVNSCLVLVFSCHGWDITTVEHLGNRKDGYSEVQKRIAAFNGSQCGYCTPGWVMHLTSLIDKHLTMEELEKSFGSNTCRCTGFRPIYDAIQSFAIDPSPTLCQRVKDIEELSICDKSGSDCDTICSTSSVSSDWSLLNEDKSNNTIALNFGNCKFFKVFEEDAIFDILNKHGMESYMFVDGNTGKGIVENFEYPRVLIDINAVASLKGYDFDQNLVLGANVSLEDAIKIFKEISKTRTEFAYLAEFVKHFELVAHIPVRKIGSIAGNLMYKRAVPTYQSDLFVMFECVGAYVTIRDSKGVKTTLRVTEFLLYDMRGKLMINIELPPLSCSHIYRSYKVMPRNQNALAIVNAAFLLEIQGYTHEIKSASIVYGNIDPRFVHASETENFLIGKNIFSDDVLQQAIRVLSSELIPAKILGEPSKESRKKLGLGLFYKFILNIAPPGSVLSKYKCGGELLYRPVSKGTPEYQTYPNLYPLNKPIIKLEAQIQSAGEATYSNDIPPLPREVFAAFVLSTVHSGEVDAFDIDHLMAIEGVVALFTPKDIPGVNSFTVPGIQLQTVDEEILATKIKFYGQPIAVVVAKTEKLAADVAKKVKVTYKNVSNAAPVLTIDVAKKDSNRYLPSEEGINPTRRGTDVKKVIKGVYEQGAQYHYYLEPITCVVIPVDDRLEIYDSSQWIDAAQIAVARSLAISESEIIIKVRRVGGAFGGKLSRHVQATTACALVAKKLDVPCRFILPMQSNLTLAGRRLPAQCDYEVGVDDNGKIQYLNATMVEDKGCAENDNVLSFTVPGFKHCYNTDTWTLKAANVLTDTPCNTFARAPGTSEGISSIEHIMQHIAFAVDKDPTEVRKINMRTEDNDLPELIDTLKSHTDYEKRVIEIKNFNKANRWVKKAITVNIMLFPVIYYGNYSAFVSIYRGDGTVTVSTGGIEMGQGINTKAAQVCAYELEIPLEFVKIIPHYSFIAANNVFSGSSITTESVSYAIIRACEILKERLAPIRASMPNRPWKDIISRAGDEQINLCAHYMMRDTDPALQAYSAFGVVILETELDVLTGRFQITRTDILEDVGISGNPKLDVGQVEGAFVQGLGYYTCEKLVYDEHTGRLLSNRSLNYHVPLGLDIPIEYNVKLRYNSKNTRGVLGSKTCGEMGICLAHSINHALRLCIMESRQDSGYDPKEWLNIPVPYDTERILKALNVNPEEFLLKH